MLMLALVYTYRVGQHCSVSIRKAHQDKKDYHTSLRSSVTFIWVNKMPIPPVIPFLQSTEPSPCQSNMLKVQTAEANPDFVTGGPTWVLIYAGVA